VSLLNNAIKFSPEGGNIGLNVESDPEHHMVYFTVWDTGIGIAKEDIEHLFQPFVQLDSTLSRKYEGIGLGLTLVYRIADMHGGSISVESEVDKGSRFTLSLPWGKSEKGELGRWRDGERGSLGDRESPDNAPHPPTSPSPQLPTVLIAEDSEFNIETFSNYLLAKGYRVITARNGEEAIERAQENKPDIILIDLHMPVMGGLEAIRHFRMDQNLKTIPIIAITALVIPGGKEKCLAAGADEYFSKPVSLRKLSELFEKLLTKEEDEQHE
jgi:CheY-like chemotaxis protein